MSWGVVAGGATFGTAPDTGQRRPWRSVRRILGSGREGTKRVEVESDEGKCGQAPAGLRFTRSGEYLGMVVVGAIQE